MTSSTSVVKTTNPPKDDFFLCRTFAKAISADKLLQIIEQQPMPTESPVESVPSNDNNLQMIDNSTLSPTNNQWKVGDLCLCPYSEDGLLYKATIIHIDASSCTVSFDDYGNEEIHLLADLQIRIEEQQQQESLPPIDEDDILPPPPPPLPPFPILNPNDDNDTLSSTLMSWYLAGYHTGFYQGIKDKK